MLALNTRPFLEAQTSAPEPYGIIFLIFSLLQGKDKAKTANFAKGRRGFPFLISLNEKPLRFEYVACFQ